jgi:hypothetical protein
MIIYRDLMNQAQLQRIAGGDMSSLRESVRQLDERIIAANTETAGPSSTTESQQSGAGDSRPLR